MKRRWMVALALGLLAGRASQSKAAGEVPPGYQVLRQTDAGLLMVVAKPQAKSLAAATESALNDLDDFFDEDYDVYDGFEDQRTHASLLSGIKAKYHGKTVRGLLVARKSDAGVNVFVAFANDGADRTIWSTLTSTAAPVAPTGTAPIAAPSGLAPEIKLHDYQFPDGTGVIGLADGYTTHANSCGSMFQITGAGEQELTFGATFSVNVPNSTAVQLARQYPTAYNATMLVAPYADPATVLMSLVPQLSRIQQSQGSYATTIDHLRKVRDLPPSVAHQLSAVMTYGATRTLRGRAHHFQAIAQASVTPISNDAFMYQITTLAAPDATFQQDLPTMLTMASSLRENSMQIMAKSNAWVEERRAWFAGVQNAHSEQTQAGDDYIHASAANSKTALKSVVDFDETIIGTRTVEDQRTGERTQVDLGNVDQVVDELNKQDPGRYKQIKLRDQ